LKNATYYTTSAQTNDPLIAVISSGTKLVITGISVICATSNTVYPSCTIGFGTANIPTLGASGADGVDKIILSHGGIAAGSGIVLGFNGSILAIGANDEDLRITCTVPTGGDLRVSVQYFTIES
jgi:hypothetical protein